VPNIQIAFDLADRPQIRNRPVKLSITHIVSGPVARAESSVILSVMPNRGGIGNGRQAEEHRACPAGRRTFSGGPTRQAFGAPAATIAGSDVGRARQASSGGLRRLGCNKGGLPLL
jgi:hypothetical protein